MKIAKNSPFWIYFFSKILDTSQNVYKKIYITNVRLKTAIKKENKNRAPQTGIEPVPGKLILYAKVLGPVLQTSTLKRRMAEQVFYIRVEDFGFSMLS